MSRWFRFYDDAINDPKILKLSAELRWIWVCILCIASKNNGTLPSAADVALLLRLKPHKSAEAITNLVKAGLIDESGTAFAPHNWSGRQYKSDVSTERVKRYRNGERNVPETPPDNRLQNTDTEKKKTVSRAAALASDWPSDYFDQFWKQYPKREEKRATEKVLAQLRKGGKLPWVTLIGGVMKYAASRQGENHQFTKQPPTWLNKGCWDDEIQPSNGNGHAKTNLGELALDLADQLRERERAAGLERSDAAF